MEDEILEQEIREQLLAQGVDPDSVDEMISAMSEMTDGD